MAAGLEQIFANAPLWALIVVTLGAGYALLMGADRVVDRAVLLALHWHMPKMIIGATIVSLGTTLPEAAVSVAAAIQGQPDLALGNAVGSIICNTGLILGLAALLGPLPLPANMVNRHGWLQLGVAVLLCLLLLPWPPPGLAWRAGGGGALPQAAGFLMLMLLGFYLWFSMRWAQAPKPAADLLLEPKAPVATLRLKPIVGGLVLGLALIILGSKALIPAVSQIALRAGIPPSIIAATFVAFGTSLPELITAVTAVRRGHGELAVGNVMGANILNVLFVSGAAAAVTPAGLAAPATFFTLLLPGMLVLLLVFCLGISGGHSRLPRPLGLLLLAVYAAITWLSYQ
ncbi:MAG: sodium:calcium antiporter [Candidatus Marinimicrobia bacterium]|nr:sodium:calcium antiporter [Candidatus Neomarinimicrobiota bacterium]